VLADLGCGEGNLELLLKKNKLIKEVHSYDLVPVKPHVKVCDMANLPLGDSSVDIAVFCLSLMGTNYIDFIFEAIRILRINGIIIISEVTSRFACERVFMDMLDAMGLKKVYFVNLF